VKAIGRDTSKPARHSASQILWGIPRPDHQSPTH
jgi:hypothetical protein